MSSEIITEILKVKPYSSLYHMGLPKARVQNIMKKVLGRILIQKNQRFRRLFMELL